MKTIHEKSPNTRTKNDIVVSFHCVFVMDVVFFASHHQLTFISLHLLSLFARKAAIFIVDHFIAVKSHQPINGVDRTLSTNRKRPEAFAVPVSNRLLVLQYISVCVCTSLSLVSTTPGQITDCQLWCDFAALSKQHYLPKFYVASI